jgi:ketol-acid reductoisomerase
MRYSVSNTAEYGDYMSGPRIITDDTRAEMKRILSEIQEGVFARNWIAEHKSGAENFKSRRQLDHDHGIEVVGRKLRKLMSWIDSKEV